MNVIYFKYNSFQVLKMNNKQIQDVSIVIQTIIFKKIAKKVVN